MYRTTRGKSETDPVDQWTHHDTAVTIFLSNLEGAAKQVELVERIPVAEIEHVRVKILPEKCQPVPPTPDRDGFCRYRFEMPPNSQHTLQLRFRLSTAPGVKGL